MTWRQRRQASFQSWAVVLLAVIVSGGIYSGVFTVSEAASIGGLAEETDLVIKKKNGVVRTNGASANGANGVNVVKTNGASGIQRETLKRTLNCVKRASSLSFFYHLGICK